MLNLSPWQIKISVTPDADYEEKDTIYNRVH